LSDDIAPVHLFLTGSKSRDLVDLMGAAERELLRSRGLRVTGPRVAVLAVLDEACSGHEHLSVAQIADRARARAGALSLQGVYDCLEVLTGAGLARKIEVSSRLARYEGRTGDNHHHLVCRGCGAIIDVDCVVGAAPCLQPVSHQDSADFVVDEAEVVFRGYCQMCRANEESVTHD
jgi:Fur family ferric uptake transcriptional regulator